MNENRLRRIALWLAAFLRTKKPKQSNRRHFELRSGCVGAARQRAAIAMRTNAAAQQLNYCHFYIFVVVVVV